MTIRSPAPMRVTGPVLSAAATASPSHSALTTGSGSASRARRTASTPSSTRSRASVTRCEAVNQQEPARRKAYDGQLSAPATVAKVRCTSGSGMW